MPSRLLSRRFLVVRSDRAAGSGSESARDPRSVRPRLRSWTGVFLARWGNLARIGLLLESVLVAAAIGIFVLDLMLPRGTAPEFLYPAVIYFSLWSLQPRFPILLAVGCTALMAAGGVWSPAGAPLWIDMANRFLGAVLVWITLELGRSRQEIHQALQRSHAELESKVRQRTAESSKALEAVQHELLRRIQAERHAAEGREHYKALFDRAPYPMWVLDFQGLGFLDVNRAAVRHYGYSREQFLSMTIADIVPLEDAPLVQQALPAAAEGPRIAGVWRHRRKDGSPIDVELGVDSFNYRGRNAWLVVVNDVTESLRMTERVRASEERYRRIFLEAPIGVVTVEKEGRLLSANTMFCQMVEYDAQALVGKPIVELMDPDDRPDHLRLIEEMYAGTRRSFQLERRYHTKNGRMIWGNLTGTMLHDQNGAPLCLLGMIEETTEQRRAESTKVELVRRILTTQEEERGRIARELHDGIGQTLTALAVGLRAIEGVDRSELAARHVTRLRHAAAQAVEDVRRIARGLRPSVLDDLGLEEALRQYLQDFSELHRLRADLEVTSAPLKRLPMETETALYRIVQEATTNAAKHADARQVRVRLECGPEAVEVSVDDDGCGFQVENGGSAVPSGLGLQSIRERAAQLDGWVEISSADRKGTVLRVRIPMKGVA